MRHFRGQLAFYSNVCMYVCSCPATNFNLKVHQSVTLGLSWASSGDNKDSTMKLLNFIPFSLIHLHKLVTCKVECIICTTDFQGLRIVLQCVRVFDIGRQLERLGSNKQAMLAPTTSPWRRSSERQSIASNWSADRWLSGGLSAQCNWFLYSSIDGVNNVECAANLKGVFPFK